MDANVWDGRKEGPDHQIETIDILLVDDRPENLLTIEAVLEQPGYNFVKAESGDEALRYLLEHEPALILLDVQMPGMDGFQTASLIKNNDRLRDIPIIFMTAINTDERYVHQGYSGGAVDYIYKPFDAEILKAKVAVFADLYRKTLRLVRAEQKLREAERLEREKKLRDLELRSLRREQVQQQRYRDLVESISHGIVWSATVHPFSISFVSESAERISGYTTSEWVTDQAFLFKHVHPDDCELFMQALELAQNLRAPQQIEHRFLTLWNQWIWLRTSMRFSDDSGDNLKEVRCISMDITASKDAEMYLQRSKRRSDLMAHASLTLSETLDPDVMLSRIGQLTVPAMADWYSIDRFDEKGRLVTLAAAHLDPTKENFVRTLTARMHLSLDSSFGPARVYRTGKPELYSEITPEVAKSQGLTNEQVNILKELGVRSAMIVPVSNRGRVMALLTLISSETTHHYDLDDLEMAQDLAGRIGVAMDNSRLYQESQAAIRARDEFLSIASHELKTPLTPLVLQVQGIQRAIKASAGGAFDHNRLLKLIDTSDRQLDRLSRLVDDLLDIARINTGRFELQLDRFDLSELINDVVERFRQPLATARCEVTILCQAGTMVVWDRFRIEQVIVNLLTNAFKYGPGKPIEISVEKDANDNVALAVTDHGIGIDKKDQIRIFERFERAVSASHFGGLGLGLYIVSQIIKAHGGQISVRSEPNKGSTFLVYMPSVISPSIASVESHKSENAVAKERASGERSTA